MSTPRDRIEALRERAEPPEDGELILRFSDRIRLKSSDYSDHRREKLSCHVVRIAGETGELGAAR